MGMEAYIGLAVAVLILMLKPGPVMITCMTLAMDGRWRSILAFWTGYLVVRTMMYFFLLTGLSTLPEGFGMVFLFLKGIASVMFISLGLKGLNETIAAYKESSSEMTSKIGKNSLGQNFLLGGLLQVSNPYDYVFILTIIPAIMGTIEFSLIDITYINLVVIFFDAIVNAAYIIPILYSRKFMSDKIMRKMRIASSGIMVLIGGYIFATIFIRDSLESTNLLSGF